jgi:hypothetical protein
MSGSLVFPRGSHVLEYWLAHAEGFTVRSRGSVERVIVEPLYGRATALVVRSGPLRRRRVVSAAEVAAVDPEARVLELERTPKPEPRPKPRKEPRTPRVRPLVRAVWAALAALVAWFAPRLRAFAREALAVMLMVTAAAGEAARDAFERGVHWYEHRNDAPYLYGRRRVSGPRAGRAAR